MTVILAICHAFRTNKDFSPSLLYLGTFLIDCEILQLTLGKPI